MAPCSACVCYKRIDDDQGECHNAPPVPEENFPMARSEWPIVQHDDACSLHSAGVHAGTTCDSCVNYAVLDPLDPGACTNVNQVSDELCADAECLAIPPTPVGEFRGELSLWVRVLNDDYTCCACYDPIV